MDKYIGKRLDGRYEIRELIGIGGMAYVYKSFDCLDNRIVAVKILRDEFLTNEEFVRRFRNESKAIAILNHPNIVKVLDVGFGQDLQYIVMEYIDGITLKEYLDQRKDIRWKEAVHFAVQILRALQHAHDKGIVHRDIKPQNIMLLPDGTIKVTDFGIARLSRSEMRVTMDSKKAIGTVHYISPEQARGENTDEKTDLYSVGVVLYEMLTGRLPFEADNAVSVAIMQMQAEPTMPRLINEDIPEGLEQITIKAMQKDAEKRYRCAAEMLNDFDEFKRNPSINFAYTYFVDETPTRYADAITRVRGDEEPSESSSDKQKKRKVSIVAILSAVAAAIVLVTTIAVLFVLGVLGNNGAKDNIIVDNFIGKHFETEVKTHENYGNYSIDEQQNIIYAFTDKQPEGCVFRQDPAPGTSIKMKGKLTLYVSRGSEKVTVLRPKMNESVEDFRARLEEKGFVVREESESSDTIEKGELIRTEPEYGAPAEPGSEVIIYVSSGRSQADMIDMPNVLGMSADAAKTALVKAGFDQQKITIKEVNHAKDSKGTVVAVTPNHTLDQYPDVDIELQVSTGYKDVNISVALPSSDMPVDVQVFVDGALDKSMSLSNIIPRDKGALRLTTKLASKSYKVRVQISVAGKNNFKTYANYTVNGSTGSYSGGLEPSFSLPDNTPDAPQA